jgi:hypothetical protein
VTNVAIITGSSAANAEPDTSVWNDPFAALVLSF